MFYLSSLLIFVFGLCLGSFLNVLILRLKNGEQFMKGRSRCPKCGRQLSWTENIPLISFIVLKGRCASCHKKISWQYPLVELITGILFLVAYQATIQQCSNITIFTLLHCYIVILLKFWLFIAVLIVLFVYDLRFRVIPDIISLPAIVAAFAFNLVLGWPLANLLISGIIGSVFFLVQFVISRGKWIGGGDIRLGALMGVMLGFPGILVALFLAYISGSVVSIFLVVLKHKGLKTEVPFAPFLTAGTLVALFYGQKLVNWYLNLL